MINVLHKMSSKTYYVRFYNGRASTCLDKVISRISVVNWGSSVWKEKLADDWVTIGA